MTLIREFNLYLTAGKSIPLVINVNQFDSGEQWVFTLYKEDGTQYIPSTGAIVGIKSDGLGIINSGSVVDGKVVINETEQMTAAAGKAVFELLIDSQTHGTANFVVLVEPKPGNNADLSESDLSLLQEAIDATSPLPTGGTVGQVLTKTAQGSAWSNAGTPTQAQVAEAVADWADENITVTTGVVIDQSLSVQGAAADAKKTGDEISDLKSAIQSLSSIPYAVKQAMDNLFAKSAYADSDAAADYATFHAWATEVNVLSVSAVFAQGTNVVYDLDTLDSLRQYLTVTAVFDNGTSSVVGGYTLSGELEVGSSTITVGYEGKTTTFTVSVSSFLTSVGFFKGTSGSVEAGVFSVRVYDLRRAIAFCTKAFNGALALTSTDEVRNNGWVDPKYPIPIPNGATKISVALQGDLRCAMPVIKYQNGTTVSVNNGSWSANGGVLNYDLSTFIANGGTHLLILFGNSNTTSLENYTIDSTTVQISFS